MSPIIFTYLIAAVGLAFLPQIRGGGVLAPPASLAMLFLVTWMLLIRDPLAGTDAYNYAHMYEGLDGLFSAYHGDYFFTLTGTFFKQFGLSGPEYVTALSILMFAFSVLGIFLIVGGNWKWFILSLGMFIISSTFILLYFNALRQGLALSLGLLTVGLELQKKRIPAVLTGVAVVFSHTAGFILAAFIVLSRVTFLHRFIFSLRGFSTLMALCVVIALASPFLIDWLGMILGTDQGAGKVIMIPATGALIGPTPPWITKLVFKLQTLMIHGEDNALVLLKIVILAIVSFMLILLANRQNQDEFTERARYLGSIVILITLACILLFQFQEVAGRLLYFANPFVTILIAGVFFQRVVARSLYPIKALIYFLGVLSYGWFVLVYPSTARQLGV